MRRLPNYKSSGRTPPPQEITTQGTYGNTHFARTGSESIQECRERGGSTPSVESLDARRGPLHHPLRAVSVAPGRPLACLLHYIEPALPTERLDERRHGGARGSRRGRGGRAPPTVLTNPSLIITITITPPPITQFGMVVVDPLKKCTEGPKGEAGPHNQPETLRINLTNQKKHINIQQKRSTIHFIYINILIYDYSNYN